MAELHTQTRNSARRRTSPGFRDLRASGDDPPARGALAFTREHKRWSRPGRIESASEPTLGLELSNGVPARAAGAERRGADAKPGVEHRCLVDLPGIAAITVGLTSIVLALHHHVAILSRVAALRQAAAATFSGGDVTAMGAKNGSQWPRPRAPVFV